MSAPTILSPFTRAELFEAFETDHSPSKHLLVLYSLVVGLDAKTIVDLGIGATTRALRAAASVTAGIVHSCDFDRKRYGYLLEHQDASWRLSLDDSGAFLSAFEGPIDLLMHDAAHHYAQVRRDLEIVLPKMRRYGVVCVHDAQQTELAPGILAAVTDVASRFRTSSTVLPFGAGLLILRVEESAHAPVTPAGGRLPDGRPETTLACYGPPGAGGGAPSPGRHGRTRAVVEDWRIRLGHLLRQKGLR